MKLISYELTMPNVGSWNGKWTGSENKYYVVEKIDDKTAAKLMNGAKENPIYEGFFERRLVGCSNPKISHYYNFGDGWGANVCLEVIDSKEAAKRRKISKGFLGYEWMISSIKTYGEILNSNR